VFWHHPRFSSGEHGNDSDLDTIWRKLYNANVDLVINGHDHDYERFARQTPDAVRDDIHGIRELIVGTGGKSLRTFGTIKANSQVRFSDAFGVVKLTLLQHGYRSEWQSAAGEPTHTDVNTEDCH
jgi:acid phosphatase type 7